MEGTCISALGMPSSFSVIDSDASYECVQTGKV